MHWRTDGQMDRWTEIYDEADSSFQQYGEHANKCYLTVNMWLHSLPKLRLLFWSTSSFFGRNCSFIWGRGVWQQMTQQSFPFLFGDTSKKNDNFASKTWSKRNSYCDPFFCKNYLYYNHSQVTQVYVEGMPMLPNVRDWHRMI